MASHDINITQVREYARNTNTRPPSNINTMSLEVKDRVVEVTGQVINVANEDGMMTLRAQDGRAVTGWWLPPPGVRGYPRVGDTVTVEAAGRVVEVTGQVIRGANEKGVMTVRAQDGTEVTGRALKARTGPKVGDHVTVEKVDGTRVEGRITGERGPVWMRGLVSVIGTGVSSFDVTPDGPNQTPIAATSAKVTPWEAWKTDPAALFGNQPQPPEDDDEIDTLERGEVGAAHIVEYQGS